MSKNNPITELENLKIRARELANEMDAMGTTKANAEKEYRVALNKKVLELKDEGMTATLISMVIYGYEEIAEKRAKRDIAESSYEVIREKIQLIKKEMTSIENQLQRDWNDTKYEV